MTTQDSAADRDWELRIALDGHAAGRSVREIAEDLYGSESVASDWGADSVLRAQTRRLVRKAQAHAKRG